jgi:DEAD/DEAH box helicase domain-containing protein
MVHEEAIYIHEGQQYQVEVLDLEEKKAFVRAVDVDYYTDAEQAVNVKVLDVFDRRDVKNHGEVEVTYLPTIFKKIKLQSHENVGWGRIHLSEDPFHTSAYWLCVPESSVNVSRQALESGLQGVAYVLGQVAPLFLMCDPRDIAVWAEMKATFTGKPTVFVYDRVPGGIGFSRRLFQVHQELLGTAIHHVSRCGCEHGCPSCVGPRLSQDHDARLRTLDVLAVLWDRSDVASTEPAVAG